ncbi:MAG: hypothetical protein IT251_03485 [Chitinophagaceae bacterium]|nr:hypothetical protein [Chitinophagaceae bacterium]
MLQAATYNNSLQNLAEMLNEWKEDAEVYKQKIEAAEQQGKPTAGMDIYLAKQLQKIRLIETTIGNADAYIYSLLQDIESIKERMSATIQQQQQSNDFTQRVRIIDLPHSADYYHNNIMEQLFEIKELLQTNTNGEEKRQ